VFFECLFGHPLQNLGRWSREEFVPATFRFDLSEKPGADRFLFALGQFVRFVDGALQKFPHGGELYAVSSRRVSGRRGSDLQTLMRVLTFIASEPQWERSGALLGPVPGR
jgi:hypothetical protein